MLAINAAYARWPWSDLGIALLRNGRFRQDGVGGANLSIDPIGVPITSHLNGLYFIRGFTSPAGIDPSADLTSWSKLFNSRPPTGPRR